MACKFYGRNLKNAFFLMSCWLPIGSHSNCKTARMMGILWLDMWEGAMKFAKSFPHLEAWIWWFLRFPTWTSANFLTPSPLNLKNLKIVDKIKIFWTFRFLHSFFFRSIWYIFEPSYNSNSLDPALPAPIKKF